MTGPTIVSVCDVGPGVCELAFYRLLCGQHCCSITHSLHRYSVNSTGPCPFQLAALVETHTHTHTHTRTQTNTPQHTTQTHTTPQPTHHTPHTHPHIHSPIRLYCGGSGHTEPSYHDNHCLLKKMSDQ